MSDPHNPSPFAPGPDAPGGWPATPPEGPPGHDPGPSSGPIPFESSGLAPDMAAASLSGAGRGWATPESGGHDGGPDLGPSGGLGVDAMFGRHDRGNEPAADAPGGAPPLLPVPLKPLTLSDLLDGSWAIIKARPKTVFLITAAVVIPVQLVVAFLQRGFARSVDFTTLFANGSLNTGRGMTFGSVSMVYLGAALSSLSYFFLGGAIARLVSAWYAGFDLSAKDALVSSLRKGPVFVAAFLLLIVPKVVSVAFCYVPAFFVIPLFMLTVPAIVIENLGPIAGARRSWTLVSRRLMPCIGIWFVGWFVELVVNQVLSLIPQVLAQFTPDIVSDVLTPAGNAFAHMVTAPVVVGMSVLLYLDLRIRTEGLDLELEAADVFARAV